MFGAQFKLSLLRYWLAMNASALQSGVHAVRIFCGMAGAHVAVESINALNLQQLAVVFLIAFGSEILNYLDKNPLTQIEP